MTKLKKYTTIEEWETAKSDFVYPKVGLVGDDSVVYMTRPPLHTLPIKAVFFDSATGSFVKMYPHEITEAIPTYTPIGVEVIPAEHDVYGTGQAGIISLASMSYKTPNVGDSDNWVLYWGGKEDTSLTNYDAANYIGIGTTLNDGVVQGVYNDVYFPADWWTTLAGLDGKSGYNYGDSTSDYTAPYQAPSPYNADGSRNEAYYTTAYSATNVLSDFDGIGNTKTLTDRATAQSNWKTAYAITNSNSAGYYPAACCCWRYRTAGTYQGQWYLPAAGELGYVMNRIGAINDTINKVLSIYPSVIGGEVSMQWTSTYWSSSEISSNYAWLLKSDGRLLAINKTQGSGVRAFFRL